MRCEATNENNKRKDGKRKEDGYYDGRRVTNHQNAGRTAGGTSKKRRSDDARTSTRRGEDVNKKDLGRLKKRKDGPNKGAGNAVDGNSGKKGNRKNDGPTVGKRSKKSGSDVASSRKTSGKAMIEETAGRTKEQNGGYSKGYGGEVGANPKATGSRGEFALGMRVGASSKGSGSSNAMETDGANATEVSNGALSEEHIYKSGRRKEGGEITGSTIVTQPKKKKKRKKGKGSEKKKSRKHMEQATAKHRQK